MKPLDAFSDTLDRSRLLLRMHDGLVDQRQRSMRSDWARNFEGLMRWPAGQAIARVDTREAIVVFKKGANLGPGDFTRGALDELLRGALALGVSALDRYLHERVTQNIVASFRSSQLTKQQRDFTLPLTTAMQIAKKVRGVQSTKAQVRPANEIRKAVQDEIHKRPFQRWRDIEDAFALIGIKKLVAQLQTLYGVASFDPIRKQLTEIVRRRNCIVHEGDIKIHERGGTVKRSPIKHSFVLQSLDFLAKLVANLEKV